MLRLIGVIPFCIFPEYIPKLVFLNGILLHSQRIKGKDSTAYRILLKYDTTVYKVPGLQWYFYGSSGRWSHGTPRGGMRRNSMLRRERTSPLRALVIQSEDISSLLFCELLLFYWNISTLSLWKVTEMAYICWIDWTKYRSLSIVWRHKRITLFWVINYILDVGT